MKVGQDPARFGASRRSLAFVFFVSYALFFLIMPALAREYDEGLMLVAAMRVGAGQIPHSDFYFIYGPVQPYVLAGLFKIFGPSVLVERCYDLFLKAALMAAVYGILSRYCRPRLARWMTVLMFCLMFGIVNRSGSGSTLPVSLLIVVSTALLVGVFEGKNEPRRLMLAGALGGLTFLCRYDSGIALLAVHGVTIFIAAALRSGTPGERMRSGFHALLWYLPGFFVVALPPVLLYLHAAPIGPFLFDVFQFPSKYYYPSRNLPFPRVGLKTLQALAVYLPIVTVATSALVVFTGRQPSRPRSTTSPILPWRGFLISFGLLCAAMYAKGLVRTSLEQMYLAIVPMLLLIAVLLEHREELSHWLHWLVLALGGMTAIAFLMADRKETVNLKLQHAAVIESLLTPARRRSPEMQRWCRELNPATRGMCFYFASDDREEVIDFLEQHTKPGDALFVGDSRHDRIFVNDNITYFITGLMPATRWSDFNTDLQSGADIQKQMIEEIDHAAPPYVVLDSEWADVTEPNDSAISSGVTLLDDYLRTHYHLVQTFGKMSVQARN